MNKDELNKLNWTKVGKCNIERMAYDTTEQTLWLEYCTGEFEKHICLTSGRWEELKRANGMSINFFKDKLRYCFQHSFPVPFDS